MNPIYVVVEVRRGSVQSVYSNNNRIMPVVVDFDNKEIGEKAVTSLFSEKVRFAPNDVKKELLKADLGVIKKENAYARKAR